VRIATSSRDRFIAALGDQFGPSRLRRAKYTPVQSTFYPRLDFPAYVRDAEPQFVFRATSTDEVSQLLALANKVPHPLYVRQGSGQVSIDTLSPFPPGAVILDLRELKRIKPFVNRGYLEVGPSVTLAQSNSVIEPLGYRFPVAVEPVTWGGLVTVNLSGHLVDAVSGKPGDAVLGLEVVLPRGDVIRTGTEALRKVVGPDLTRLFIGSQGLYGVVTGIRLRLVPKPAGTSWGWAVFPDVSDMVGLVIDIYNLRLPYPTLLEWMDDRYHAISGLGQFMPAGNVLLFSTQDSTAENAQQKMAALLDAAAKHHAVAQRVDLPETWERLWQIRESPHHHYQGDYLLGEVLDVPLDLLDRAVHEVDDLRNAAVVEWPGLTGYLIGHVGNGTIHPAFSCPSDWTYEYRVAVARELRQRVLRIRLDLGATVGEQGIFPEHAAWFTAHFGDTTLEVVQAIKSALDPNHILNPTRLTPEPAGST
jgi:FAD/FMN-containing dehydrogenase